MSQRAVDKLKNRKTKPATYNLDLNLIADYWGWFKPQRSYHHTGDSECLLPAASDLRHHWLQREQLCDFNDTILL